MNLKNTHPKYETKTKGEYLHNSASAIKLKIAIEYGRYQNIPREE